MEPSVFYTIGTVAWNTGLVAIAGELTRRWMNGQEKKQEQNQLAIKDAADRLADDLKGTVTEHRQEIKEAYAFLSENLKGIYEQLRIANGRTSKIEGGLDTIKAVCSERHSAGRRVTD